MRTALITNAASRPAAPRETTTDAAPLTPTLWVLASALPALLAPVPALAAAVEAAAGAKSVDEVSVPLEVVKDADDPASVPLEGVKDTDDPASVPLEGAVEIDPEASVPLEGAAAGSAAVELPAAAARVLGSKDIAVARYASKDFSGVALMLKTIPAWQWFLGMV